LGSLPVDMRLIAILYFIRISHEIDGGEDGNRRGCKWSA
jgi:hypothetical protein